MDITPTCCTLAKADMDTLTELIGRVGYQQVIGAMGDILAQDTKTKPGLPVSQLSAIIGMGIFAAKEVDRACPSITLPTRRP